MWVRDDMFGRRDHSEEEDDSGGGFDSDVSWGVCFASHSPSCWIFLEGPFIGIPHAGPL